MSGVDELRAEQHATPNTAAMLRTLSELLGITEVGLLVVGVTIFGAGPKASVDIELSNGTTMYVERFADVTMATKLSTIVVTYTGTPVKITGGQATQAAALMRRLAELHDVMTGDDIAWDWGTTCLQSAEAVAVDLRDQASRWDAFAQLDGHDPVTSSRERGCSIARGSYLLVDASGARLVRCGWFGAHVRSLDPAVGDNAAIAHRMERVGWQRRGQRGSTKATQPGGRGVLIWNFYVVVAGWGEE